MSKRRSTYEVPTVTIRGTRYTFLVYGSRWNLTRESDGARFYVTDVELTDRSHLWPVQ